MRTFRTLAFGTCMTIASAGAAFAQSSMSSMSAADKATMTNCQGMSQSAMQSNADCSALMKKYPDAGKGTTGSSSGMNGGINTPSPVGSGTSPGSSSK